MDTLNGPDASSAAPLRAQLTKVRGRKEREREPKRIIASYENMKSINQPKANVPAGSGNIFDRKEATEIVGLIYGDAFGPCQWQAQQPDCNRRLYCGAMLRWTARDGAFWPGRVLTG